VIPAILGGKALDALVPFLTDSARKVLDRVLPDVAARERAEVELAKMEHEGTFMDRAELATRLAQAKINEVEAASPGLFRGGWRPFVGWTCAAGLAFEFLAKPVITTAFAAAGHPLPPLPGVGDALVGMLVALLGIGSMRTVEKMGGLA
jgi:Holin of 3TMs, for gene-transfer release